MAQLTIYIDDKTLERIERSAQKEHGSVSGWVRKRLNASLDSGWPAGYFEIFASLKENKIERPAQPPRKADRKRIAF
ncbi:MAG: toxin-antitoxin system, antitoxin component [Candidatus Omnitrophica bacterium]|nr:toxin-antitoxin system, antitoxin component [Candidatus Omnitrophota bacterium]